jgi:hypothetical protein
VSEMIIKSDRVLLVKFGGVKVVGILGIGYGGSCLLQDSSKTSYTTALLHKHVKQIQHLMNSSVLFDIFKH